MTAARTPQRPIAWVLERYAEARRTDPAASNREIAARLGMTLSGMTRALQRARAKARTERS